MKKLIIATMTIAAMFALAVPARSQDIAWKTVMLTATAGTNTAGVAHSVAITNNTKYAVWTLGSLSQNIPNTLTNSVKITYTPTGSETGYRIGVIAAQASGAETPVSLANYPPIRYGDVLSFQSTLTNAVPLFLTYGIPR